MLIGGTSPSIMSSNSQEAVRKVQPIPDLLEEVSATLVLTLLGPSGRLVGVQSQECVPTSLDESAAALDMVRFHSFWF